MMSKVKDKKDKKKSKKELEIHNLDNVLMIELSDKSIDILTRIAKKGIWGNTKVIVAERFIDLVLQNFVDVEDIKIKL